MGFAANKMTIQLDELRLFNVLVLALHLRTVLFLPPTLSVLPIWNVQIFGMWHSAPSASRFGSGKDAISLIFEAAHFSQLASRFPP